MGSILDHNRSDVVSREEDNPKTQHTSGYGKGHHQCSRDGALFETKGISKTEYKIGQQIAYAAAAVGNKKMGVGQINLVAFPVKRNAKRLYQRHCAPGTGLAHPIGHLAVYSLRQRNHSCKKEQRETYFLEHFPAEEHQYQPAGN